MNGPINSPNNYLQIKLHDLLKHHDQKLVDQHHHDQHAKTLPHSLGDGYLYQHNTVFKNIRDHFIKLKGQFTTEDFCHYHVFPYASLPQILKANKVPYSDNVTVLREIEKLHPKRFTCAELIKVKSNYTLHESSHCVADFYLEKITSGQYLSKINLQPDSKKAFRFIMAESFANSVESIANVYNTQPEQRLFYELNSYVTHSKKINSSLQQTVDLIGPRQTFALIYISYLYSNCLLSEPSAKQFQQILEVIITDTQLRKKAGDSASLRKLFSHGFELSLDFRLQTTGFFCTYSGINTPLEKLFKIDVLEILKNFNCVQNFLSSTQPLT